MHLTGFDTEGEVRAFELETHPFFIGTLFQPERSALRISLILKMKNTQQGTGAPFSKH